jgi:chorismate mutase
MSTSQSIAIGALRGATTVERDERSQVLAATGELLSEMMTRNDVDPGDVISILFTATPDLTSEFPAAAARSRGLAAVPLMCASEMAVKGAPERCVRILIHLYTGAPRSALNHVYLRGARVLREDLGSSPGDASSSASAS